MKFFFVLLILASATLQAKIEIEPYKKNSWNNEWNEAISQELDQHSHMLTEALDPADLRELSCPGFNKTEDVEAKKDFWTVFFSGLTRAESAFNPKARSKAPKGGHGNYGLVQLSKRTAREQCGLSPEEIADPAAHLRCAVKLMSWQLKGAPISTGKLHRPDLKNQLFGKYILLWGPLRQNDKRGRALLTGWFKKHLEQMPFCKVD